MQEAYIACVLWLLLYDLFVPRILQQFYIFGTLANEACLWRKRFPTSWGNNHVPLGRKEKPNHARREQRGFDYG